MSPSRLCLVPLRSRDVRQFSAPASASPTARRTGAQRIRHRLRRLLPRVAVVLPLAAVPGTAPPTADCGRRPGSLSKAASMAVIC